MCVTVCLSVVRQVTTRFWPTCCISVWVAECYATRPCVDCCSVTDCEVNIQTPICAHYMTHLYKWLSKPPVCVQDDDRRSVGVVQELSEHPLKCSARSIVHAWRWIFFVIDVELHENNISMTWNVHFVAHLHVSGGSPPQAAIIHLQAKLNREERISNAERYGMLSDQDMCSLKSVLCSTLHLNGKHSQTSATAKNEISICKAVLNGTNFQKRFWRSFWVLFLHKILTKCEH